MHRSLAIFVAVVTAGLPACATLPVPKATELEGQKVVTVSVVGNESIRDRELIDVLAHRPPGRIRGPNAIGYESPEHTKYDPTTLRLDRRRIGAFYRARGYFRARVTDVKTRPVPGGVALLFKVDEGQRTRISAVDAKGIPKSVKPAADAVLEENDVRPGRPFVHQKYIDSKDSILRALEEAGYAHAEMFGEVRVHRDQRRARVSVRSNAGPRVRFGATIIDPKSETVIPEESILARVTWEPGDAWHPEKENDTRRLLRELGFASVRVGIDRAGRRPSPPAIIKVNDGKRHELRTGFGVARTGTRFEGRVRGEYSQKRFLHPLMIFRVGGELGRVFRPKSSAQYTYETNVSVTRLDLFAPLLSGSVAGGIEVFPFEAFNSFDTHVGAIIERPFLARRLRLEGGWQIHRIDLTPREGVQGINDTVQRLAFFEQALTLDLRDDRLSPRKGLFAELKAEQGGAFSGSEVQYVRGVFDTRAYLPLGRVTLAGRASGGVLAERETSEEPLTRRFYAGGSGSHRGFNVRRLSPFTDTLSNGQVIGNPPVGGKALALASGELRFRLTDGDFGLSIAGFWDAGDVTANKEELDLGNLHHAVGGGIRLQTPVGPLRVDVGFRLNRRDAPNPDPGDTSVIHITFGEAF